MADQTVYQLLAEARAKLKAALARADAAENILYDRYFVAVLTGLAARFEFGTPARSLIQEAEKLTLAALEARRLYKAGASPNVPPVAAAKPKETVK